MTATSETTPLIQHHHHHHEPHEPHHPEEDIDPLPQPPIDAIHKPQDEESLDEYRSDVSLIAVLPSLLVGVFLAAMDNMVVASIYGRIGSDLNQLSQTSWIATAYLLTTTCFQPLYGKLSDIFGRKACLLFAYATFAIGSCWCGLARSMDELIVARAFAGIGGGGMTALVSIVVSDLVPLHKRGTWQGFLNVIYATGASSGAPLGGLMADGVGWRWAFLFQTPATLLAAFLVLVNLNIPHRHPDANDRTTWQKFKRIDFAGAFTLVPAVLTLLIALDRGGNISWSDKTVMITAPISAVLFISFLLIEGFYASDPFAPPRIIFDRGLSSCYAVYFFSMAGFFAILFYLPLYFQAVMGLTAAESGLRMLPAIIGSVSGSLGSGIVMQKTGKYYILTTASYVAMVFGCGLLVLYTGVVGRNFTAIGCGLAITGLGSGSGITTILVALIARSGSRDQAVSTAVSYLFRSLGSVVGVSVGSTLLQGSLRAQLRKELKGVVEKGEVEEIVRKVTESLEYLKELRPEVRGIVVAGYEGAVRHPFVMSFICSILTALASLFVIEQSLKKDNKTAPASPSDSGDDTARQEQEEES
ncbi:hypothetical protein TWF730_009976 [Orbilia blumenaviensis]|uniref:Major facilitator superfamily (MFS) profile domain-containing protein n=1 Tax=Orbilia blumenaviensis TaxID=1796055 RepID=A0AAV9UU83_9PEZI